MKNYKELKITPDCVYDTYVMGSKKRARLYVNITFNLDIETTSYKDSEGIERAWMYIWQVGFNQEVYYGRWMHELKEFFDYIANFLDKIKCYIICYVHNLPYEFCFLSAFFDFKNIFARKTYKVIKCEYRNIEFRCSYMFSNMSLDTLSKNYCQTRKLKGDLDYLQIRYPETELTEKELEYCHNDAQILNELWDYIYKEYIYNQEKINIPLTNTAKVRIYCKNQIKDKQGYTKALKQAFPSEKIYNILEMCFKGGYNHANVIHANKILKECVRSFDFTSSYPAIMIYRLFPMSKFREIKKKDFKRYLNDEKYAKIIRVSFFNLKAKTTNHTISFHKLLDCDFKTIEHLDNGRVMESKYIELYCTDLDLKVIKEFYTGEMIISEMYVSVYGHLPKFLIDSVVHFYDLKNKLKHDKTKKKEYMNSKNMLNSTFGMMVSKVINSQVKYDKESGIWDDSEKEQYKFKYSMFLLFQWGVWVTSWAQYNLLLGANGTGGVKALGANNVYNDTDSIKYIETDINLQNIFYEDNTYIKNEVQKACEYYNIDYDKIKGIGEWEKENDHLYSRFKTLGCKKYLYEDRYNREEIEINGTIFCHNYHPVVSGCKASALIRKSIRDKKDLFMLFNDRLELTPQESEKITMKYCYRDFIEKYKYIIDGNEKEIEIGNFIYSEPCSFKFNLGSYMNLIRYYLTPQDFTPFL